MFFKGAFIQTIFSGKSLLHADHFLDQVKLIWSNRRSETNYQRQVILRLRFFDRNSNF